MPNIKVGDVFINRTDEINIVIAYHELTDHFVFYNLKYNVYYIESKNSNSNFGYWYKRLIND